MMGMEDKIDSQVLQEIIALADELMASKSGGMKKPEGLEIEIKAEGEGEAPEGLMGLMGMKKKEENDFYC